MSLTDKVMIVIMAFMPWILVVFFSLLFSATESRSAIEQSMALVSDWWMFISPFSTLLVTVIAVATSKKR